MNDADTLVNELKTLAREEDNLAVLWLYGSRAKGTAQANSDFDLAVAFNTFPHDDWEKRLQPELLQQRWSDRLQPLLISCADDAEPVTLSVVDINHIPLPLAYSIVRDGKPLLVKDAMRLYREEHRISSMWEVDYLWHEQHYG